MGPVACIDPEIMGNGNQLLVMLFLWKTNQSYLLEALSYVFHEIEAVSDIDSIGLQSGVRRNAAPAKVQTPWNLKQEL